MGKSYNELEDPSVTILYIKAIQVRKRNFENEVES